MSCKNEQFDSYDNKRNIKWYQVVNVSSQKQIMREKIVTGKLDEPFTITN